MSPSFSVDTMWLFLPDPNNTTKATVFEGHILYQMRFSETMDVAVDYRWDVHVLAIGADKVGSEKLHAPFLDNYPQQAVRLFVSDEFAFYFFYPDNQDLFRVTIAPSA